MSVQELFQAPKLQFSTTRNIWNREASTVAKKIAIFAAAAFMAIIETMKNILLSPIYVVTRTVNGIHSHFFAKKECVQLVPAKQPPAASSSPC
jgi:hypothetical protein